MSSHGQHTPIQHTSIQHTSISRTSTQCTSIQRLRARIAPLALLALMAAAPTAPVMRPTRDVKIVYAIQPPNAAAPIPQFQYWNVGQQKLRIDLPTNGAVTLIDLRTNQVQLLRVDTHTITALPSAPPTNSAPATNHDLTKGATQTIAGLSCTEWTAKDGATVCFTADGVLLRAMAHGTILSQAISVDYAPQPTALFIPPADYKAAKR
jgi:hypothetical protein